MGLSDTMIVNRSHKRGRVDTNEEIHSKKAKIGSFVPTQGRVISQLPQGELLEARDFFSNLFKNLNLSDAL